MISGAHPQMIMRVPGKAVRPLLSMRVSKMAKDIVIATAKISVRRDIQHNVEIARRATPLTRLALPCQTDLCAAIYTRGNLDVDRARGANILGTPALGTRKPYGFTFAVTGRTRSDVNKRAEDRLLDAAHFASAVARGAAHRRRARLRSTPLAFGTRFGSGDLDIFFDAKNSFLERNGQIITQIRATARGTPCRRAAHPREPAKELFKDIVKAKAKVAQAALRSSMTKAIIGRTLLFVREHLIGFIDFLKACLCVRAFIDVGVILTSQPSVGLFDLVAVGLSPNTEHIIIIALGCRHGLTFW